MGFFRLFLAFCVVLNHVKGGWLPLLPGSVFAVQTFFSISGFYIAMIWNEKYGCLENGRNIFWANRWLRLAPAYILVSTAAFALDFSKSGTFRGMHNVSWDAIIISIFSTATLIGQDLFSFINYNMTSGNFEFVRDSIGGAIHLDPNLAVPGWYFQPIGPGWSIGVEIWFYLIAPFIVSLRYRSLATLLAFGILIAVLTKSATSADQWNYRFFPSQLMFFMIGIFAYRVYAGFKQKWQMKRWGWIILAFLFPMTVLFSSSVSLQLPSYLNQFIFYLFQIILIFAIPFIFAASKDSTWDRRLGMLSYPLYIVHMPIIENNAVGSIPTQLAVCLIVSAGLVALVEIPIEKIRISRLLKNAPRQKT